VISTARLVESGVARPNPRWVDLSMRAQPDARPRRLFGDLDREGKLRAAEQHNIEELRTRLASYPR